MTKFKVGERVKVYGMAESIEHDEFVSIKNGQIATIVDAGVCFPHLAVKFRNKSAIYYAHNKQVRKLKPKAEKPSPPEVMFLNIDRASNVESEDTYFAYPTRPRANLMGEENAEFMSVLYVRADKRWDKVKK